MDDLNSNINEIKTELEDYLSEVPDVALVYLYGSQAAGSATAESDVDIAILFNEFGVPGTDRYLQMEDNMTSRLKREVDLLVLNSASPVIRMQVLNNGTLIIKNDHQTYIRFFVKTVNEYDDLKKVRQINERNILKGRIYG